MNEPLRVVRSALWAAVMSAALAQAGSGEARAKVNVMKGIVQHNGVSPPGVLGVPTSPIPGWEQTPQWFSVQDFPCQR